MYDKEQFPHYSKVSFPEHLQPGETVWIRKGMHEWEIGAEHGPKVKTAGPLKVVSVMDRPTNTTPLVRVREQKFGYESDLCASLLSRESSEPGVIVGVLLWEGRNKRAIQRIQAAIKDGKTPVFDGELFIDHNPIPGLHIFGYVYERGAIYKDGGPGPGTSREFVVKDERPSLPENIAKKWKRAARRALRATGATGTARKVDVTFRSFFNI